MRNGLVGPLATAFLTLVPIAAAAQAAPIPRTPDGRPNLQGVWQVLNTASWDIQDHHARLGVPAGKGVVVGNEVPYQPWALTRKQENFAAGDAADPAARGYMPGVPRVMYMPFPFQIFQSPSFVVMTFEFAHSSRTIYTNGTPHPRAGVSYWLGDSRGHWDGDTLVVDVVHFTDQTWFDRAGNFHSEALHLVERYSLMGPDHLSYEVTVEDPKVFTRPWTMRMIFYRRQEPDVRVLEYEPALLMLEQEQ